jgi:hypothetical protein
MVPCVALLQEALSKPWPVHEPNNHFHNYRLRSQRHSDTCVQGLAIAPPQLFQLEPFLWVDFG